MTDDRGHDLFGTIDQIVGAQEVQKP